jgi:hypothetical protein
MNQTNHSADNWGNGVYKARAIFSAINPGFDFDNLNLCNSQGVYRTTNTQGIDSKAEFKVYPNPASEVLNIDYKFSANEKGVLTLFNAVGGIVYKQEINQAVSININQLAQGLYTYKFITDLGKTFEGKVIIQ